MSHNASINDSYSDSQTFFGRVVVIGVFIVILTLALLARLVYLQIVGHEHYATRSKNNRIKISPIAPTRGLIYDRHGRTLANNIPAYSLVIIPEQVPDMDHTLLELQSLLSIPDDKIKQFHKMRNRKHSFSSTPLLVNMTDQQVAQFAAVRPYFPGVDIKAHLVRYYPYPVLTSHVLGYVGRINERELKKVPEAEYSATHYIGKTGIEKTYESQLHGHVGYAENLTNAQARIIKSTTQTFPTPGSDLYLTVDIDLQKTAYDALDKYNGAVVAIEVKTGQVLALTSRPGFNANLFVSGISSKNYKALQTSDSQPLFDRTIRGQYPPGSTMKPFIGLAGLENHAINAKQQVNCPGYFQLPNNDHKYRDWKRGGHGLVNLKKAITQSCDVYFYKLAVGLGIDKMSTFLGEFGFGHKTGIDLVREKGGLLPSRAWKKRARNQVWFPGETVITGIGQGFTQVTPLQLASATATLANRGNRVKPVLLDRMINADFTTTKPEQRYETLDLDQAHVDQIFDSMINVVHGPRGTARRISKGIDYQIAGKTGTAQVFTVKQEEKYNEEEIAFKLRDHALFIAFAPAHDPQIAVAVIVENGGHGGSVAAPIAKQIIAQYLNTAS